MSERRERQKGQPALELIEEAVVLLRRAPPAVWLSYYLGAVPFWLALLYFVADMSQSAFAGEHVAGSSLLVALLYLWKKCCHAAMAGQFRTLLLGDEPAPWTATRVWRLVVSQVALQPWGLLVRPLAWVATLPAGWVSGFFQHLTAGSEDPRPGRRAWRQTLLWPWQLHALYGALILFSIFVWLNAGIVFGLLPSLLKTLTGIETAASRSGSAWAGSSTFFLVITVLTVLVVEPLWKAVFVLRRFYGESLETGADLQARLRSFRPQAALVLSALLLLAAPAGQARDATPPPPSAQAAQLDRNIDHVLQRREYAWRLPRREEAEKKTPPPAWLTRFGHWAKRSWDRLWDWLRHRQKPAEEKDSLDLGGFLPAKEIVYVLLFVLVLVLLVASWLAWRRRGKLPVVAAPVEAAPDLQSDSILASQLPEEGWMRLMREMLERGDLRLALRAAYLGCLAQLGERHLLSIARHKSNRDYQEELRRRARSREGLLAAFSENLRAFERVWYGRDLISHEDLARFAANVERMRAW